MFTEIWIYSLYETSTTGQFLIEQGTCQKCLTSWKAVVKWIGIKLHFLAWFMYWIILSSNKTKGSGTLMTSTYKDNAQSWDAGLIFIIPTCLRHALSMGTFVWKVSQILYRTRIQDCFEHSRLAKIAQTIDQVRSTVDQVVIKLDQPYSDRNLFSTYNTLWYRAMQDRSQVISRLSRDISKSPLISERSNVVHHEKTDLKVARRA